MQRAAPDAVVAQNTVSRLAVLNLQRGLKTELLKGPAFFQGIAFHLFQLQTVIKGKGAHSGPIAGAVGGPMHLLQLDVIAQIRLLEAALKEKGQLFPAGIGRGTAVTTDRKGPTGIGVFEGRGPVFAIKPTLEQTRHKPVPRAQHVEHLNRKARPGLTVIQTVRNIALKRHSPVRTAFTHQRRARHSPHRPQGRNRVRAAARDVEFLFGAHDQVKVMQAGLQFGRDLGALDKAALAIAMARHAPKVRAVINVQRRLQSRRARDLQRL